MHARGPECVDCNRQRERGIDAAATTPAQLTDYLKSETAKWTKVVKASNIKPD